MSKVTLKDILDLTWTVQELSVDVRNPDTSLVHQYIIGPGKCYDMATPHQQYDIDRGMLTMIDADINVHGRAARGGSEIAWGTDFKAIPKELLDMEVTHFLQGHSYNCDGTKLFVHLDIGEHQEKMRL